MSMSLKFNECDFTSIKDSAAIRFKNIKGDRI